MKVTYTGIHHELPPKVQAKLDAKFTKLSKMLDGRGEHTAHVIVTPQKRGIKAEVTVQFYDHQFVGAGTDGELFNAMTGALAKIETQAVKHKAKWRETHRKKDAPKRVAKVSPEPEAESGRVFRVNGIGQRKPMTVDEAVLEMSGKKAAKAGYLAFCDAETDMMAVLIRRADGHFDLIES